LVPASTFSKVLHYDPARARALLDEMGCKPKRGGVRHRFGIMLTPDGDGAYTRGAKYVKQALSEVGLDVFLEATDYPTQSRRSGQLGIRLATTTTMANMAIPPSARRASICRRISAKGVPLTNLQGYINPEVDRLFAQGAVGDRSRPSPSLLQQAATNPHPRRRHAVVV